MRMVDLIMKTRHGEPLSKNEIEAIVSGFTSGKIPDYHVRMDDGRMLKRDGSQANSRTYHGHDEFGRYSGSE